MEQLPQPVLACLFIFHRYDLANTCHCVMDVSRAKPYYNGVERELKFACYSHIASAYVCRISCAVCQEKLSTIH